MSHHATGAAELPEALDERFAAAVRGKAGLVAVPVAQCAYPLWLRAGTEDETAAATAFELQERGLKFVHQPRRILEIGGGSGYRAVALAHLFPGAEILSTEADPAHQRVAMLNTLPYARITSLHMALAALPGRYAFYGRKGEAGRLALVAEETGQITATPLAHLLNFRRWNDVDTIIMTPDAASETLLTGTWPRHVQLLAVETGGVPLPPEITESIPNREFLCVMSGDYMLFYRRGIQREVLPVRGGPVFAPDGAEHGLTLEHVPEGGFFLVGSNGFRLQPNPHGGPPARLTITRINYDHAELHVSMRVARPDSPPVRFFVQMRSLPSGMPLVSHTDILNGGDVRGAVLHLPHHEGPCEIVFSTEMGALGADSALAWAEFISATFI